MIEHSPFPFENAGTSSPTRILAADGDCIALVYLGDGRKRTARHLGNARIISAAGDLVAFASLVAGLETESECDERTDGDGMSGDNAVDVVSSLVIMAREIMAKLEGRA